MPDNTRVCSVWMPDLDFEFALVPGALGGEPFAAGAASPGYAINADASDEAKEAAKTFLTFLASPEGVEIFHEQTNDVTVTSDFEPTVDEAFAPMAESIRSGQLYLPMISWQRSEDVLNVEAVAQIQRMIQGQIEPVDVAKAMDAKLAAS
ncbi:extracellular solute-binding protein [Tessaracoccus lapidicaptus]|uniref:extracellular solute-binding protein n=1 Tax=Tessaracoccus lapidicaptus TaxID=1427523 RepID=UPI00333E5A1F